MQTSGGRWKMNVEKVVRQVGLGVCVGTTLISVSIFLLFPSPKTIPRVILTFVSGWYLLCLQSDPISEDEFMTKWNTAVGYDLFSFPTHLSVYSLSFIPSFGSNTFILLLLCGTFN